MRTDNAPDGCLERVHPVGLKQSNRVRPRSQKPRRRIDARGGREEGVLPQQEGRAKCSTSKLGENSTYEKRLEYKTVSASDQQLCNARRKHCSTGKEFARSEHGAIATAVSRQQTFNRATTVGAAGQCVNRARRGTPCREHQRSQRTHDAAQTAAGRARVTGVAVAIASDPLERRRAHDRS